MVDDGGEGGALFNVVRDLPGYTGVLDLVSALGLVAEPVGLDDSGPLPAELRRALRSGAQVLWSDAALAGRLRSAAATYASRRRALLDALAARRIGAYGRSGLNVWLPVAEEGGMLARLADAGWAVRGEERYRMRSRPALRITVSTVAPRDAERLAADIARALAPAGRTSSA